MTRSFSNLKIKAWGSTQSQRQSSVEYLIFHWRKFIGYPRGNLECGSVQPIWFLFKFATSCNPPLCQFTIPHPPSQINDEMSRYCPVVKVCTVLSITFVPLARDTGQIHDCQRQSKHIGDKAKQ